MCVSEQSLLLVYFTGNATEPFVTNELASGSLSPSLVFSLAFLIREVAVTPEAPLSKKVCYSNTLLKAVAT